MADDFDEWNPPACPTCGAFMSKRFGERGPFWSCSEYPRCRATRPFGSSTPAPDDDEAEHERTRHGWRCPLCSAPMYERTNRTDGDLFLGCSKYPRCTGTRSEFGDDTSEGHRDDQDDETLRWDGQ